MFDSLGALAAIKLSYKSEGARDAEMPVPTKAKMPFILPLSDGKHQGEYDSGSKLVLPLSTANRTKVTLTLAGISRKVILPRASKAGMTASLKFDASDNETAALNVRAKFLNHSGETVHKVVKSYSADDTRDLNLSGDLSLGVSRAELSEQAVKIEDKPTAEKYRGGIGGYALSKSLTSETFSEVVGFVQKKLSALASFNGPVRGLLGDDAVAWKQPAKKIFKQTDHMASFLEKQDLSDLNEKEKSLYESLQEVSGLNANLNQALANVTNADELKAVASAGAALENKSLEGGDVAALVETAVATLRSVGEVSDDEAGTLLVDAQFGVDSRFVAQASFTDPLQAQSLVSGLRYAKDHEPLYKGAAAQQKALSNILAESKMPEDMKQTLLKDFDVDSWPSIVADLAKTAKSFVTPIGYRKADEDHVLGNDTFNVVYAEISMARGNGKCIRDKDTLVKVLKAELQKRRNEIESASNQSDQEIEKVVYSNILPGKVEALDLVVDAVAELALQQVRPAS